MTKHNIIWVDDGTGFPGNLHRDVVVLTIDELSNLWNAGHKAGWSDAGKETKTPAVDFETYLQSKGITL